VNEKDRNCLVFDLYSEGDFQSYIVKKKASGLHLPEVQILRFFANMILAIHFINSRGIFHRDLKPENFLMNMKNNGKLYLNLNDFGIAKNLYSNNQSEISTTTGVLSGSI
jgi:NIMA (never in mitosis gene a)-related kinase